VLKLPPCYLSWKPFSQELDGLDRMRSRVVAHARTLRFLSGGVSARRSGVFTFGWGNRTRAPTGVSASRWPCFRSLQRTHRIVNAFLPNTPPLFLLRHRFDLFPFRLGLVLRCARHLCMRYFCSVSNLRETPPFAAIASAASRSVALRRPRLFTFQTRLLPARELLPRRVLDLFPSSLGDRRLLLLGCDSRPSRRP
jgi:hypothetical protein